MKSKESTLFNFTAIREGLQNKTLTHAQLNQEGTLLLDPTTQKPYIYESHEEYLKDNPIEELLQEFNYLDQNDDHRDTRSKREQDEYHFENEKKEYWLKELDIEKLSLKEKRDLLMLYMNYSYYLIKEIDGQQGQS